MHISRLADRFVKDPAEVVKVGDKVRVVVLDVDLPRQRISLSARPSDRGGAAEAAGGSGKGAGRPTQKSGPKTSGGPGAPTKKSGGSGKPKTSGGSFANNPFAKLRDK